MARSLRIEYPGALYHVTSRGDRQEAIFEDDADRHKFLEVFANVVKQMQWVCYGYCLMDNHYHLIVATPDANLAKGMRQINGTYTQASNRRHNRVGHLFQGRYKSIVVDGDAYLLELARYVVLNPVRAGLVSSPGDWQWSSYGATVGSAMPVSWLNVNAVLEHFSNDSGIARREFSAYVQEGIKEKSIWQHLQRQIFLGEESFISRVQEKGQGKTTDPNIPGIQRRPPAQSLPDIAHQYPNRDEAILAAYATGDYSYAQIADYFKVHFTTVGRIIRKGR